MVFSFEASWPLLPPHRTQEIELRLEDPKSKEDDMGVIIVDVRLMYRDATIKKGPVRIFLDVTAVCVSVCTKFFIFVN